MRETKSTTSLGLTCYTCYDGEIDNDVLDRAVERLTQAGAWVNGHTTYELMGELARYIAEERTGKTSVYGMIMCDWEDGICKATQVEDALSKKFNRHEISAWILK